MNDYAQRICVFCMVGDCDLCVGRYGDRWCQCCCPWMQPPRGDRMTQQPIEDDEYAEDAATVPSDDLPEPTDPSQVPPDEGDAGAAK